MLSLEYLTPYRPILYFSPEEYRAVTKKLMDKSDIHPSDVLTIVGLIRDLLVVSDLQDEAITTLKAIVGIMEDPWFANQIDNMDLSTVTPDIYDQLALSYTMAKNRISNYTSILDGLKMIELTTIKILDILKHTKSIYEIPDNVLNLVEELYRSTQSSLDNGQTQPLCIGESQPKDEATPIVRQEA